MRRSNLAGDFGKGEPLADYARECKIESLPIGDAILFLLAAAIVITKYLLINVPMQVKRLNRNIGSGKLALEQRPKVFDALGMYLAPDIGFHVVNHFMREPVF